MRNLFYLFLFAFVLLSTVACQDDDQSVDSVTLPQAFSVAVGLTADANGENACSKVVETLTTAGAAANCIVVPVACQSHQLINPGTSQCVELRGIIPQVTDQAALTAPEVENQLSSIVQTLQTFDETVDWPDGVTYVLPQGHSQGKIATGLLLAMRATQDQVVLPSLFNHGQRKSLALSDNSVQPQSTITVSNLKLWNIQASVLEGGAFERQVYAPDFTPGQSTSSSWALYALEARVKNGEFKCLRGHFRQLSGSLTFTDTDGDSAWFGDT